MDQQLFCWRHFSKIEVVQNTDLNILTLYLGTYLNLLQFPNSKKNSFRGNYMRKYGIFTEKNQWKIILTDDWLLVTLAFCPSLSSSIGAGSSTTSAGTTSFGGSGGDAGGSDPANRANLFRRIWKSKFQCNVLTEKKNYAKLIQKNFTQQKSTRI